MVKALRKSVVGLALGAALMMGWGTASQAAGSELKIAFPVDIPSWDPTSVTFPAGQSIYKAVFDSPLFVGDDLKVAPRLIESWEWADEQGQALKVKLRDKVKFHDGSDMTAEDLKFTFDRAINKKTLALNGMLPTLKSVEVTGPLEAMIHFSSPTPTAPKGLAFLSAYILPKAYFEKVGEEEFLKRPIGAGPYKLSDYQRGSRITLEAFEDYWQGAPDLKQVVFEIVPDSSARVAAVESGRADVSVQIPVREIARLEKNPKLEAKVYPYSEIYILQMPSYVESFKDVHVRRAMNMAIDWPIFLPPYSPTSATAGAWNAAEASPEMSNRISTTNANTSWLSISSTARRPRAGSRPSSRRISSMGRPWTPPCSLTMST